MPTLNQRFAAVSLVIVCACGPSVSDELAPAAASDTGCHVLPEAVHAQFPEVAETHALELHEKDRALTIGVDSQKRVRVLTTSSNVKRLTSLTVRAVVARFDADGQLTSATRTTTTGDVESRATSSNAVPVPDADTGRVRELANEALRRCVR